jgi:hypothetical protein
MNDITPLVKLGAAHVSGTSLDPSARNAPREDVQRARLLLWTAFGTLGAAVFWFSIIDFAAQVDGPRIGFFGRSPMVGGIGILAWFVSILVGSVEAARAFRHYPRGVAIATGVSLAVYVLLPMSDLPRRSLSWKWGRDCDRGSGVACRAAADIRTFVLGGQSALTAPPLYERACDLRDEIGCINVVERNPNRRKEICERKRHWSAHPETFVGMDDYYCRFPRLECRDFEANQHELHIEGNTREKR